METAGVEPAFPRCKRGALPLSYVPRICDANGWSRTTTAPGGGFTGRGARRCSAFAQGGRPTGFEPVQRGSRPRMLPLHHGHHDADDRTRTGGLSVDSRALCTSELRPQSARLDSNQRSPAPEAGGVGQAPLQAAASSRPPAGLEPAPSRLRAGRHRQLDHGGMHVRQSEALESNQALLDISEPCLHGHRPPTTAPERTEGEGVEPPRP